MPAQNPAPLAERMPFAIPSTGKKRERGDAKKRSDVHRASVHRQNFLAVGNLFAQFVESAGERDGDAVEAADQLRGKVGILRRGGNEKGTLRMPLDDQRRPRIESQSP